MHVCNCPPDLPNKVQPGRDRLDSSISTLQGNPADSALPLRQHAPTVAPPVRPAPAVFVLQPVVQPRLRRPLLQVRGGLPEPAAEAQRELPVHPGLLCKLTPTAFLLQVMGAASSALARQCPG